MQNNNPQGELKQLEKSAEQGNLHAQHLAGKCNFAIFKKTHDRKYLIKALEWHEKAANLKDNNLDYQIDCKLAFMEAFFLLSDLGYEDEGRKYLDEVLYWSQAIDDRLDPERLHYLVKNQDRIWGCSEPESPIEKTYGKIKIVK
jgi:hypothetical protein